jgi:hypothetical protein
MSLLDEHQFDCPNCGEEVTIVVDKSIIEQQYVEDCFVCCSPIIITVNHESEFQKVSCTNETDLY